MAIDTLANIKYALGISGTGDDDQIAALLAPVSALVETLSGRSWSSQEVTEQYSSWGAEVIALRRTPVSSISSVVDRANGSTIASTGYEVDGTTGLLRRLSFGSRWEEGLRRYEITYTGGQAAPADVKLAFYEIIQRNLTSQGGLQSEKDGDYSYTLADVGMVGVPAAAMTVLNRYKARPI